MFGRQVDATSPSQPAKEGTFTLCTCKHSKCLCHTGFFVFYFFSSHRSSFTAFWTVPLLDISIFYAYSRHLNPPSNIHHYASLPCQSDDDIKGPGNEIQIGKLAATVSTMQASIGKLYVMMGGLTKVCSSVQQNITSLGQTLAFVADLMSNDVTSLKTKLTDESIARKDSVDEAMFAVQQIKIELSALISFVSSCSWLSD